MSSFQVAIAKLIAASSTALTGAETVDASTLWAPGIAQARRLAMQHLLTMSTTNPQRMLMKQVVPMKQLLLPPSWQRRLRILWLSVASINLLHLPLKANAGLLMPGPTHHLLSIATICGRNGMHIATAATTTTTVKLSIWLLKKRTTNSGDSRSISSNSL